MDPLLAGGAQAVSFGHNTNFFGHDGSIAVGQKEQRYQKRWNMDLSEHTADRLDPCRGHQKKGRHQTEDAFGHEGHHGDHSCRHDKGSRSKRRRPVQKRIQYADRAHQRKHKAKLVQAGRDRHFADREQYRRIENHEQQSAHIIFVIRYHDHDVSHCYKKLRRRAYRVDRRSFRCKLVHLSQIVDRLINCPAHIAPVRSFYRRTKILRSSLFKEPPRKADSQRCCRDHCAANDS